MEEIHASESMKKSIADAYGLGIEFAREATRYYSRSSSRRVLEAITKPPSLGIDEKIAAIATAMADIGKERDTVDSQRLYEVQRDIDEVKRGVDEVRESVKGDISLQYCTSQSLLN